MSGLIIACTFSVLNFFSLKPGVNYYIELVLVLFLGKKADTPKRGFISYFKDEDIRSFLMIKLMTSE